MMTEAIIAVLRLEEGTRRAEAGQAGEEEDTTTASTTMRGVMGTSDIRKSASRGALGMNAAVSAAYVVVQSSAMQMFLPGGKCVYVWVQWIR
jgi:hypothetical protein